VNEPVRELDDHKVSSAIDSAVKAVEKVTGAAPVVETRTATAHAPPPTPITDDARINYGEIIDVIRNMSDYYGYEGEIPEHVLAAFENNQGLKPAALREKILQKMHIHLLSKWARREIPGPMTVENLELLARRAEETAKNMEKMKKLEAAESQRQKAAAYRATVPQPRHGKAWW
jgi:hypothetical protein